MKSKYSKTTRQLLDEIRQNQLDETITAVKNKAKKTGMPYGILKKVYDRGMAAWKGGHRPGATQIQWALARVNSFVTKSSGTWGGADKDLAKKVRAAEGFDPGCPTCIDGECQCSTPEIGRVCESCGGEECMCSSLEESKMSEIDRMSKGGKSAEEIAKALKLDVKAVKSVLGEARQLKDKDKETMVHKGGKVIVIDKSDLKKYKAKGYEMAEQKDNPYAIGMSAAMKSTGDEPPLKKSTIKKAHDIADKIKNEDVELEEKMKHISFDKARPQLPPHLKKLFDKDGNFINPKSQAVFDKMVKDAGGFDGLRKKYNIEEKDLPEACWTGFKQVGMKKKGGKMVPNCVPTEDKDYDFKALNLNENLDVRYDTKKQGWFDRQGNRRYLGIGQTNTLMKKALDKAIKTGDFINPFKMKHGQKAEDLELQERAPRRGDYQVNSQKKDTPIKNIDHFATKQQADAFAAKVKKDGGKVDSITKLEDLDAQPQDKDVKKVKGTQPKKYYKDLKKDTKKKRADFFKNRPDYKKSDDDDDYKAAPGDKTAKTEPSTFTKKFKKMYGEEVLNEFTAAQIKTLEKEYAPLRGKRMSPDQLNKMMGMIKRMSKDQLNKLAQASIPFVTSTAKSELVINRGMKWTDFKEDINEDVEEVVKLKAEIEKLTKEKEELEKKAATASQDKSAPIPNPDTGEVPLKVGLAQAILKLKKDARKADDKMKMTGKKIMQMAKEHFMMEDVSDQAKALGLDYMNFGRYGKDGKVTHKSMGGKLQPVKGADDKKSDKKSKDSDDDKSPESVDLKARKFVSDLEKGKLDDLEIDFENEMSVTDVCDKAREQGLDDLALEIEDEVGSYVAEMEPEEAEAGFRKIVAKYSGKPDQAVEMAKKSNEAIGMMTDTEYDEVQPFLSDLNATFDMLKKSVNSDKTSKGFNPEVIDALKNTREVIGDIRDFAEVGDEDDLDLFDELDGEIEYMSDDSADHDEYTKQSKVISSVETAQKIIKKLIKATKDYEIKEATNIAKKEDESEVLTFKDLKKKLDISDIQKILPDKKKKEMKLSKDKTKIEIDPKMDISPSAGGDAQASSN